MFTTGPAPTDALDADVVHVSRNLADRDALRAELETVDADVYLVELKAAAIDVVAETALARGAEVVLADERGRLAASSTSGCRGLVAGEERARMTEPRRIMPLPLGAASTGCRTRAV